MRAGLKKSLIVLTVLFASLSLASPASADKTTRPADAPIAAGTWVYSGKSYDNYHACNVNGAAGVAQGWWTNWDCRFGYPKYNLWIYTG